MGLDQYMFARDGEATEAVTVEDGLQPSIAPLGYRAVDGEEVESIPLHYWRKCNHIQGWMEAEWRKTEASKGCEDFNCQDFKLSAELLDRFEADLRAGRAQPVPGFFFGDTDYDPLEALEDDLLAITKARDALKDGLDVFYSSWY